MWGTAIPDPNEIAAREIGLMIYLAGFDGSGTLVVTAHEQPAGEWTIAEERRASVRVSDLAAAMNRLHGAGARFIIAAPARDAGEFIARVEMALRATPPPASTST